MCGAPSDQTDGPHRRSKGGLRIPGRRQVHEVQPVFEAVDLVGGCLEGQPCLADPARPGEGEKAHAC